MATKYFVLYTLLKSAGSKGVSPEAAAKELNFAVGSVAPYMHSLRTKFGAEIDVNKNGRLIESYVLRNPDVVEANITPNRRGKAATVAKVKPVKKVKADAKAARAKVIKQVVEKKVKIKNTKPVADNGEVAAFDPDLHIAEFGDKDLADIKAQLGL